MKITKLTREQLKKNSYDMQMDEIIEIEGKRYKAVEDCTACPFYDDLLLCLRMVCSKYHRKDKKSVHFEEVKI